MLIGMTKVSKSVTKAVIPAAGLGTRFFARNEGDS